MHVISKRTTSSSTEQPSLSSSSPRRTLLKLVGSIRRSVLVSGQQKHHHGHHQQQQQQHQDESSESNARTAYCDLLSLAKDDSNIFFVDSSSMFGLDLATLHDQDPDQSSHGINHDRHERATTAGTTTTTATSKRWSMRAMTRRRDLKRKRMYGDRRRPVDWLAPFSITEPDGLVQLVIWPFFTVVEK